MNVDWRYPFVFVFLNRNKNEQEKNIRALALYSYCVVHMSEVSRWLMWHVKCWNETKDMILMRSRTKADDNERRLLRWLSALATTTRCVKENESIFFSHSFLICILRFSFIEFPIKLVAIKRSNCMVARSEYSMLRALRIVANRWRFSASLREIFNSVSSLRNIEDEWCCSSHHRKITTSFTAGKYFNHS